MFGILNINKPMDWTSRDVVNRVSGIVGRKVKCGHAGTLDPLATGVLLVCIGKATKLVPEIHEHPKSYEAEFLLGKKSETDDLEGTIEDVPVPKGLNIEQLEASLPEFIGEIDQIPPAYSAIWIKGERAYQVARRGEDIEMPSRKVQIDKLNIDHFDGQSISLSMTCGTGTYVRSVGRDLARKVGTEAVMSKLVRTSIGPFDLKHSVPLDELNKENVQQNLVSPLVLFERHPKLTIDDDAIALIRNGRRIPYQVDELSIGDSDSRVILIDRNQNLIAIAAVKNHELAPQMVFPATA